LEHPRFRKLRSHGSSPTAASTATSAGPAACTGDGATLVNTLHDSATGLHLDGIAAGLHVVIRLDDDVDEDELAERAVRLGLDAQPLGRYRYRPDRLGLNGLVLGYARQPPHQLQRAVAELFGDPNRS